MTPAFQSKISRGTRAFAGWRCRLQDRRRRLGRGLAYAMGRPLAEDDVHAIRVEMNQQLGYYPLMTLAVEDVRYEADIRYGTGEALKLEPWLDAACDRVASKWDNNGDAFGVAVDWALDIALASASDHGIELQILQRQPFSPGEIPCPATASRAC